MTSPPLPGEDARDVLISAAYSTDVGRVREGNEDACIIADLNDGQDTSKSDKLQRRRLRGNGFFMAVADGLGGAQAGEVASSIAVEQLRRHLIASIGEASPAVARLSDAIKSAHRGILRTSERNPQYRGMGATLTACLIQDRQAIFGQVGDSRGYLIRGEQIRRVTKDQSMIQALIDACQITEEQAAHSPFRNVILHALGVGDEINPDITTIELERGDYLVLCSDGLSNKVEEAESKEIVLRAPSLLIACEQLIALANERGGEDNITVVVAHLEK